MSKNRVDPVSLVFGLIFVAAALIVLLGGSLWADGHLLAPVGLIGLGIALFIAARRNEEAAPLGDVWLGNQRLGEHRSGDQVGAESGEDGEIQEAGGSHDS